VDFDCLFDKGLTLQRPEIVPFRLTPNIVDAMGVTGVEGTYRRTLEVTVGVLRDNKDTLMSVLEPFLRDPTVSWSRSGRAQRSLDAATAAASTTGASKTVGARDHENREAKDMLLKISQRLSGIYNIVHPHREKFLRAAAKRNELPPARGIGVSKEEMLPLSVPGQVQRLIDEASAPENLVQMYIGKYILSSIFSPILSSLIHLYFALLPVCCRMAAVGVNRLRIRRGCRLGGSFDCGSISIASYNVNNRKERIRVCLLLLINTLHPTNRPCYFFADFTLAEASALLFRWVAR
jgi:hypothetical protein